MAKYLVTKNITFKKKKKKKSLNPLKLELPNYQNCQITLEFSKLSKITTLT